MTALHDYSAVDLVAAYRAKTVSPVEVLDDVLAHVARWEPHLNALFAEDFERARDAAEASAARWAKGMPCGSLDGVPATVKDNIATKGVPTPVGTAATTLVPAAADAPPAARLREAGAVIFAKTTMPDFGMLTSGLSSYHKLARNPWNLAKNPGGSSAGASAASAAGYGPVHLGTDIGGSVRLPAALTGLVGLKPSLGRVPLDPPYVGRVVGPLTRTVADTALLMSVLSQPDARDSMSLPPADIAWTALDGSPKGLRIGLMLDIGFGIPLDDDVRAATLAAAQLFKDAGATIVDVPSAMTADMLKGLDDFWRARSWDDISRLQPAQREKILPYIRQWAEAGAALSGVDVIRGFNATMAMRSAAAQLFHDIDYVLSPVCPVASFPADWASPLNDPAKPFDHIVYTVCWNMTEQPAISINGGYGSGMPIGVQIVGRRFDDLGVLRMAKFFEDAREPQQPWPTPPAT